MVKKIRSCVFISGNGSNLKSIIKSSRDYNFPIKIELIISNNINAKGLKLAKKHSIPYKFFSSENEKKFTFPHFLHENNVTFCFKTSLISLSVFLNCAKIKTRWPNPLKCKHIFSKVCSFALPQIKG